MAKGLRSSTKKTNNVKLRSRVFGPVENARAERLSAKLLELASKPRPKADLDVSMEDAKGRDPSTRALTMKDTKLILWNIVAEERMQGQGKTSGDSEAVEDGAVKMLVPCANAMDSQLIDMDLDRSASQTPASRSKNSSGKVQKRGRTKLSSSLVFPVYKKGKRLGTRNKTRKAGI
ncbi:hypothetical protein MMC09_002353 [Bachmanniomyces sp. S44760]|nr:hypothetical protein [Bachmanniomyces sp. S44760]